MCGGHTLKANQKSKRKVSGVGIKKPSNDLLGDKGILYGFSLQLLTHPHYHDCFHQCLTLYG